MGSGLTVEGLYRMFPQIDFEDVKDIMGTENFDDNDLVSSSNVANYRGKFAKPLCIFFAKNDAETFLPQLDDARRKNVMSAAGISPANDVAQADNREQQNGQMPGQIPMGLSIFTLANQNEEYS